MFKCSKCFRKSFAVRIIKHKTNKIELKDFNSICSCSSVLSARRVSHSVSGGPVPRRRPGRLRLQHPADGWVHPDDHRLHHGGNLRPLHAASVSHGVPVALRPLPPPARGLRRRHIAPEMKGRRAEVAPFKLTVLFTESFEKILQESQRHTEREPCCHRVVCENNKSHL